MHHTWACLILIILTKVWQGTCPDLSKETFIENHKVHETTPVGFEPTRGDPIGLAGRRLDHSAKVSSAYTCTSPVLMCTIKKNRNACFALALRCPQNSLPECPCLYLLRTMSWKKHNQTEKADNTLRSSQAVPHPSTDRALRRLTSEFERDPVYSTWYGRQRMKQKGKS